MSWEGAWMVAGARDHNGAFKRVFRPPFSSVTRGQKWRLGLVQHKAVFTALLLVTNPSAQKISVFIPMPVKRGLIRTGNCDLRANFCVVFFFFLSSLSSDIFNDALNRDNNRVKVPENKINSFTRAPLCKCTVFQPFQLTCCHHTIVPGLFIVNDRLKCDLALRVLSWLLAIACYSGEQSDIQVFHKNPSFLVVILTWLLKQSTCTRWQFEMTWNVRLSTYSGPNDIVVSETKLEYVS